MKTHANEYLAELACADGTPVWLSYIIYGVLKNGDLPEESLRKLLDWLASSQARKFDSTLISSLANAHSSGRTLRLKKLMHHSGVNALASGVELKFCKDITVLYGGNGSGKSGYFRILNEIGKGGFQYSILPNVYDEAKPISVTVQYETNGEDKCFSWTGKRDDGCDGLALKVFDGIYATNLIDRRAIDMAAVEPLGLHQFGLITKRIDAFKNIVAERIAELDKSLPSIDARNLPSNVRSLIEKKELTRRQYERLIAPVEFTTEDGKMSVEIQARIGDLQQQDAQSTIKYKQLIQNTLVSVQNELKRQALQLDAFIAEWNKSISQYANTYHAAEDARKQYAVLSGIPGSDSDLWKQFIQKGVDYSKQHAQEYVGRCPYCHQILSNDAYALDLIKGYGLFLSDKTQRQCAFEWENLQRLQSRIRTFYVGCDSLHTLALTPADQANGDLPALLHQLRAYVVSLQKSKQQLDVDVNQPRATGARAVQAAFTPIESILRAVTRRLAAEIQVLKNGAAERQREIEKLKEEQSLLLQRQEIVRLRPQMDKLSAQIDVLAQWNSFWASISSRRVSDLSRVAHNALLTEKLQKEFSKWFDKFGFGNLKIALEVVSAPKGVPLTELRISGIDKSIPMILSEGEQKAVALAMSLAETEMQLDNVPMVFDDPVNSLDHRVISAFACMLMTLNRQIIVFTHNRMFLDSFRASNRKLAHFCKNFENGCSSTGKHIYLWEVVAANGKTGWISQGEGDNAGDILNRVQKKFKVVLSDDERSCVAELLRRAVEKLIDEVLLKNIQPCKWNVSGSHIDWERLKELNPNVEYQKQWAVLNKAFGGLSNRKLHEGEMSRENPITQDELSNICNELIGLCNE